MALAVFHTGEADQKGVKLSKLFANENYFAFGTYVKFQVKDPNNPGKMIMREAYLGPQKKLGDFEKFLSEHPDLSQKKKIEMVLPGVKGVEKMHKKGVLHRDLKPENLLVDEQGAKVADPDTAIKNSKPLNFAGTPPFMAPELFTFKPNYKTGRADCDIAKELADKTDVYSMGAVFYEITTNRGFLDSLQEEMDKETTGAEIKGVNPADWDDWNFEEENAIQTQSDEVFQKTASHDAEVDWSDWSYASDKKEGDFATEAPSPSGEQPVENWDEWSYVETNRSESTQKPTLDKSTPRELSIKEFKEKTPDDRVEFLLAHTVEKQQSYLKALSTREREAVQKKMNKISADRECAHLTDWVNRQYAPIVRLHQYLRDKYSALKPDANKPLEYLAWQCLNPDPAQRPTMKEARKNLEKIAQQLSDVV